MKRLSALPLRSAKNFIQLLALAFVLFSNIMPAHAQDKASDREELFGVWYMEWMKYDKENEILHIKDTKYTRCKVFRPDGEYASLEMWLRNDGNIVLSPHEYGTYSYKNGEYIEMGRKLIPGISEFNLTDDETINGRWYNATDQIKKVKNCPKEIEQFFVDCCKYRTIPKDEDGKIEKIEKMIKQYIFGVK